MKIRDELADSGHSEARVWGHTATGHFYDTWPMRLFDANSKGENGDSYFDYVFKDYIGADVNNVIAEIELRNYEISSADQKQSIANLTRQKVYPAYYHAYQYSMNNEKYKQTNNGTTEDVHLAEAAPLFPDAVAAIVRSTFDTKYKIQVPIASKIADSIIPKVVPKLTKKQ